MGSPTRISAPWSETVALALALSLNLSIPKLMSNLEICEMPDLTPTSIFVNSFYLTIARRILRIMFLNEM